MPNPLITALVFLISTVFDIYILLLMLRFLLQLLRVSFRSHSILQLLLRLTNPPLQLLYNFIPGWKNIDFAAIVLMLVLKMLELMLIKWLLNEPFGLMGLFLFAVANLLSLLIYIFIFALIIQAIFSWLTPPHTHNPLSDLLYDLNEPLLRPVRRKLPPMQGFDFSPMIVIIGLIVVEILVVGYLLALGKIL